MKSLVEKFAIAAKNVRLSDWGGPQGLSLLDGAVKGLKPDHCFLEKGSIVFSKIQHQWRSKMESGLWR